MPSRTVTDTTSTDTDYESSSLVGPVDEVAVTAAVGPLPSALTTVSSFPVSKIAHFPNNRGSLTRDCQKLGIF